MSTKRNRSALVGAGILAGICSGSVTACGSAGSSTEAGGSIMVFAAASLTDTFTELGDEFEREHSGTTVSFNFAGSSTLAQQIASGAPVDVFAAASPATMAQVIDEGRGVGEPTVFVRNRLEIAVPAGNPAAVTGLVDFTRDELKIALCAEEAPCGAASLKVFETAGLSPAPDTYEQDVRAALTKVELGEVDAALVYRTDVTAAGDKVEGIEFPESEGAVNDYPLVRLTNGVNPEGAQEFIDFVLGDTGRSKLEEAGFELP